MASNWKNIRAGILACALAWIVLGATHQAFASGNATVSFAPFKDPWASSRERFWDIDDNQFNAFSNVNLNGAQGAFKYSDANVSLSYDPAPNVPYFVGHISASGLKPNFAYQLKLTGKPVSGARGWGALGDDWTNEQLGYAGRWWDDEPSPPSTNINDSYYRAYYPSRTVYGYIFMGSFVTDQNGNANFDFTGKNSYHVDWKDAQLSSSQKSSSEFVVNPNSPFTVGSTSGYGYGVQLSARSRTLWYEYESGRAHGDVQLPAGKYNCRFLLTEESFHNPLSANYGGYWQTVLATEDFAKDANGDYQTTSGGALIPDADASNDVVFTIGAVVAPTLSATGGDAQIALSWNALSGASSYTLRRSTQSGGPYDVVASNITTNSYTDTGLLNGTMYFYVVMASANGIESANSNQASATPQSTPAPAAPQNLSASALSNQIGLAWSPVAGATSYSIARGTAANGPFSPLVDGITATTYSDTSAVAGTTYFYVVVAVGAGGASTPSLPASAKIDANTVVAPVIAPNGGTFFGAQTVALSCATAGVQIRYTTNGAAPTSTSTLYTRAFSLANSATVSARAFKTGMQPSAVSIASFIINRSLAFAPAADAYVQSAASINFGSASTLLAKTNRASDASDIYLRFDLSGLNGNSITSAKLRLYGALSGAGTSTVAAYALSKTAWNENDLTWSNRPALGALKANVWVSGTSASWRELNLTSYLKTELAAGRGVINIAIHLSTASARSFAISSREGVNPPQLIVAK